MKDDGQKVMAWVEVLALVLIIAGILAVLSWKPGWNVLRAQGDLSTDEEDSSSKAPPKTMNYLPFEMVCNGLPQTGQWRGDPAVCDLDHDGHLDIVTSLRVPDENKGYMTKEVLPDEEAGIYVYLGDGAGQWIKSNEGLPAGLGYGGSDTADFNGDGHPDIAFSTHRGPMRVFLGDGQGGWRDASDGIDNKAIIMDLTAADFTGDGIPDLAGISMFAEGGGIHCFENLGDSTWKAMHERPLLGKGIMGQDITSADLDRDGDMDIAVTTRIGLRVFLNDGKGEFTDCSDGLPNPDPGNALTSIEAGDVTGDGQVDLVVGGHECGVSVYVYTKADSPGGLIWKRILTGPYPMEFIHGMALGDMDNDGDLDLVTSSVLTPVECLTIYVNDGEGRMTEKGHVKGGGGRARIRLADFNNDGLLDILTVFSLKPGGVQVFLQK